MILPDDLRHLKPDAFHEGMDWPHAVGIIAALFLIAWAMNWIDERANVQVNAAPQGRAEEGSLPTRNVGVGEQPAAAAPLLAHPLCYQREQWISQTVYFHEQPRPRCVNADLRGRQ